MKTPESQPNSESRAEELKVVIESATLDDLLAIQQLNQKLCSKENREFDSFIDPEYPFTQKGEEYFRARIESPDGIAILAKEGGVTVGYLIGGMIESEDYRKVESIAELENMFVDESMRGNGIGGKLISRFEDWCKERKVQVIRVVASAGNDSAIRFYESHGATPSSVTLEKQLV